MSTLSRTARPYSYLDSESDTNVSPIGVFTNARSSQFSPNFQNTGRVLKRRKTSGLNARFDRMIEDMKFCHQKPPRRRARSSGSSSVSSYDVPKTPVDAYSRLSGGRLGQQFSLIKMNNSSHSPEIVPFRQAGLRQSGVNDHGFALDAPFLIPPKESGTDSLPSWLSNTIMTLDPRHPLRLLLPPLSLQQLDESSIPPGDNNETSVSQEMIHVVPEETSLFAFTPDLYPSNAVVELPSSHQAEYEEHPTLRPSLMPRLSSPAPVDLSLSQELSITNDDPQPQDPLPFSMPGPFYSATMSHALPTVPTALALPAHSYLSSLPSDSLLHHVPDVGPNGLLSPKALVAGPSLTDGYAYHDDTATDPSAFELIMHDLSASNPVPFSTPGPAYSFPYFDSPTEDFLTDSDPMRPTSALDCDALDFRWEPFDRKGTSSSLSPSHDSAA